MYKYYKRTFRQSGVVLYLYKSWPARATKMFKQIQFFNPGLSLPPLLSFTLSFFLSVFFSLLFLYLGYRWTCWWGWRRQLRPPARRVTTVTPTVTVTRTTSWTRHWSPPCDVYSFSFQSLRTPSLVMSLIWWQQNWTALIWVLVTQMWRKCLQVRKMSNKVFFVLFLPQWPSQLL